ncbi:MAG: phage terminase large subunit [Candidatus Peribacteraceae bacterium]|nr:phage terminase large subunit [Candidatus Peribacteraceae bacterium]
MDDLYDFIIEYQDKPERRKELAKQSYLAFCLFYLKHHFKLESADFQKNWFKLLQNADEDYDIISILGFRGCAKSTIFSEFYPLWCAISGRNKFILVISADDELSKKRVGNIKEEVDNNTLLQQDFGLKGQKKQGVTDKWSEKELRILDTLIMARSIKQRVRGLKFAENRPDLVILDDIDTPELAKKASFRLKVENFFYSEVIPAVQEDKSLLILVGNLTHKACLIAKMHKKKERVEKEGLRMHIDQVKLIEKGKLTWPAKYPSLKSLKKQKAKIYMAENGKQVWSREYLLKIIDDDTQLYSYDDIKYYEPSLLSNPMMRIIKVVTGIDLAISEKQTADYTAMVTAMLVDIYNNDGTEKERKIIILPEFVRKRMNFRDTVQKASNLFHTLPAGNTLVVEKNAYQQSAIETIGYAVGEDNVTGMQAVTDKRARLSSISNVIKNGYVMFPSGMDILIEELVNFGIEEHDDTPDAMYMAVKSLISEPSEVLAPILA